MGCCQTNNQTKVNSENTNNGIYARNTGASQIQQIFPRPSGGNGGNKRCPFCNEPIGKNFFARKFNWEKCARCGTTLDNFGFECKNCGGYFHTICAK